MKCFPWPSFDPKLTWDGLLTFLGGVLAFFAVLFQVRHADMGLQSQLNVEKRTREAEAEERQRAIATALLFELDEVYRSFVREVLGFLANHEEDPNPPSIKPVSANPFPVFSANAGALGLLPPTLVEAVAGCYGALNGYFATLAEYSQRFGLLLRGVSSFGLPLLAGFISRIQGEANAIVPLAYVTSGLLCYFVRTEFASPRIRIADDPRVKDDARTVLKNCVSQLAKETGRA
jgi:hypothetical protein